MAAPPPPPEAGYGEDTKNGVEVCLFDESADGFSRTVRAISKLVDIEPEPDFPETEVERLSSSITFLREWRHFSYEPKSVSFTNGTESTSSRDDMHSVILPQFSSASVPQITLQEDRMNNTVSFDFILYAGGNVWALDWCPRVYEKPGSSINCEYLAVSAHPPGSSYHKLGMPLTGRGIIQVWCLLAPFEDAHSRSMNLCNNGKRRGRPRKIPCSDQLEPVPKGPRGRPRKRPNNDQLEPVPKRPRGRPRKNPLAVAKFEDSSQNGECQDIVLFDPLSTSSVIPDDLPLASVKPTVKSVQSTPKRGRGRPRKNPINKLTGSSGNASEDVCTTPPSTSATCTKPKKPRGRPRKYPVPVSRADAELENGTCQPVSFGCSLDHTACTEFNANLNIVAVDAALPPIDKLPDSSGTVSKDVCAGSSAPTAICTKPKRPRGRPRKYPVPISGKSVSGVDAEVGKDTSCQPVSFGCSLDHTACTEFNANLSIVPVDAALPIVNELSGSSGTSLKESMCTEPYTATAIRKQPKRTRVRPQKYSDTMIELGKDTTGPPVLFGCSMDHTACTESVPASNESSGTSVGGKSHTMERLSKSMTKGSSKSDDMAHGAGLNQSKNEIVGCEGMKVSESNTANYDSHCNENERVNQAEPTLKNSDSVIDETEAAELVPLKESRKDDDIFSSVENSNSSSITKDMAQPRLVLCLAHNGKVAWDIKWKPPLLSQPGQKSRLGFLAVLLGNGSLEVWEVPSPCMIQKIYSPSKVEGSDPRFLKLQPVFRCVKVKCGNRQSIPLTVDWSPSPPHDMILAGCHDGTVAVWKFSVNLSLQDSKPFMCVTADSVPIRALSWAPCISEENINTFVTAGEDGLKFWDLRDPYRPLWELTTAPKAVLSLHWLKDGRGIIISLDDGTLKFLSLPRIANDVPATGRPFAGTKTQGVATYQLSEYLIWSVHASEPAGCVAYCGADGTAVYFQLNSRFWDKEPGRNRVPYFLSGSISEEGENIKIGSRLLTSPLPNIPVVTKKGSKPFQNIVQALTASDVTGLLTCQVNSPTGNSNAINLEHRDDQDDGHSEEQGAGAVNQELDDDQDDVHSEEQAAGAVHPEFGYDQDDVHSEEQGPGAIVSANPTEEDNDGTCTSKGDVSPKELTVIPPKSVALNQVRWNTNKGSERWLCYGGAAGIIRCQRI